MKSKLKRTGLLAVVLTALCLPLAVQAQVVMPSANTMTPMVTGQRVDAGQRVLFRVVNPTGAPVNFTMADLGVNYPVPANSERTFFLDMTNVTDRPQVAYAVTGQGGTPIASGAITNDDYLMGTSSSAVALQGLMNYSTAYSAPIDPEPLYYEQRPVSRPVPVRGYW
jgi:hypothetical protein